jgi:hypothetical protein
LLPASANDDQSGVKGLQVEARIDPDLPITRTEIEVFAALLDDGDGLQANDNEGPDG